MMQTMRENTKKILWVLIFAFLATIIFAWGMGGFDRQGRIRSGVLATINGDKILQDRFDKQIEQRLQQEREKNKGQEVDENKTRTIRTEVWDAAVSEILLEQELNRLGIKIGPREIAYELQHNPPQYIAQAEYFQNNGQFDTAKYIDFLKNPRATNDLVMMEADVSARLRQQRLIDLITASAMVSPRELWEDYTDRNETMKLRFVQFPAVNNPADTALVTEAEIEKNYSDRKEEFQDPEQRRVWLVSFREVPTAADSQRAKEQAEEIYQRAKKGENFADLARDNSEDNSAANGGSTGYFGRGRMVKPYEEVAFNTPIDSIARPVMSQFGWHVIKVTGKKAAAPAKKAKKGQPETPAQEEQVETSHVLFKFAPSTDTKDLIRDQAREFATAAQAKKSDLKKLAQQYNVKIDTSSFFGQQGGNIPKLGRSILAVNFAFDAKINQVSFPYYVRNAWFVVGLVEIKKEGIRPLKDVRKQIQDQLVREKRTAKAVERAEAAKRAGSSLDQIAVSAGLKVDTTGMVKATDYLPNVGRELDLTKQAKVSPLNTLCGPARGSRGAYLFTVVDRVKTDSTMFTQQMTQQMNQMLQRRQQQLYTDYMAKLKKKAKIEDYRHLMYSDF